MDFLKAICSVPGLEFSWQVLTAWALGFTRCLTIPRWALRTLSCPLLLSDPGIPLPWESTSCCPCCTPCWWASWKMRDWQMVGLVLGNRHTHYWSVFLLQIRGAGKWTWIPIAAITAFFIPTSPYPHSCLASVMNTRVSFSSSLPSGSSPSSFSSLLLHTLKTFNVFGVIVGGPKFWMTVGQTGFLTRQWRNRMIFLVLIVGLVSCIRAFIFRYKSILSQDLA